MPRIVTSKMTTEYSTPEQFQNVTHNTSVPDDCIAVVFSEMEFLPWDNPDNIISAEDVALVGQVKNNALAFFFLIGVPANIINMAVFYKQSLRDRVNLCLFTLSLVDGFYLAVTMLLHGEQIYLQFTTKEPFGPVFRFMANNNLITFVSAYFVSPILSTIIAIERCLCVFKPLKVQSLLRTRTMAVIIIVVTVLTVGLFTFVSFRYRFGCVYDVDANVAIITAIEGEFYRNHKYLIDHLDSIVFGVGLSNVEIVVVTTTTTMTVVKLRQVVTWRSETSSSISPREVALTKMLVGNSVLFIVCISPIAFNRFSWLFLPEMNAGRRHHNFFLASLWVTDMFTFSNASFNIFIYYAMGSRYRQTFWTIFGRNTKLRKL